MRSVQVSKPKGPLEIVEREIPEPGTRRRCIRLRCTRRPDLRRFHAMRPLLRRLCR